MADNDIRIESLYVNGQPNYTVDADPTQEPTVSPNATTVPVGQQQVVNQNMEQFIQAQVQSIFCKSDLSDKIQENLNDDNSDNDSYTITFEENPLNITGLTVEFKQEDGVVTATGNLELQQVQAVPAQNGQGAQAGNVLSSEEQQAKYDQLTKTILDPLASDRDIRRAKKELRELFETALARLTDEEGLSVYDKAQRHKIAKGMVEDIIAEDRFENTTVYYTETEFIHARDELREKQAAIRAKAKNGEELSNEDMAILKQRIDFLSKEVRGFVASHGKTLENDDPNNLFFTDGKFDSDKFKEFARDLTHGDANLTLAERRSHNNMFEMYAGEKEREAQQHILDGTATQEDIDLVAKTERPQWFNSKHAWLNGPTRQLYDPTQLSIVRTAGLRAEDDYRPLLKLAGIAVSIGIAQLASSLLCPDAKVDVDIINRPNELHITGLPEGAVTYTTNAAGNITEATLNLEGLSGVSNATLQFVAGVDVNVAVTPCLSGVIDPLVVAGTGYVAGSLPTPPLPEGQNPGQGTTTVANTIPFEVQLDPCKEPCPELTQPVEPEPVEPVPNQPCDDCDCEEVIDITIPRARKAGVILVGEDDNQRGIQKYEGLLDNNILDCFKVDEGQDLPEGSQIPRNQFKAFITEYRIQKLGSARAYIGSGQQKMCTTFTFNGIKYRFDEDAFNRLVADFEAHPDKYTYNGGGVNIHAGQVKDKPCK